LSGTFAPAAPELAKPSEPAEETGFFGRLSTLRLSALAAFPLPQFEETFFAKPVSTGPADMYLMPELCVQEPEGQQFFIDGPLVPTAQAGYVFVSCISENYRDAKVMKMTLCEGAHYDPQDGIIMEVPWVRQDPIGFISTGDAIQRRIPRGKNTVTQRRCTIFASSIGDRSVYATADREARGVTLRDTSGVVICCVMSGGHNTDFGNIVDNQGRLIATLSSDPYGKKGWPADRRALLVAQGVDAAMIISAVVSAVKLA
jgi:hypothetical protein